MNMFFLWLILLLLLGEFLYILLFQKEEKSIKYKQVAVRSKDGKK